MRAAFKIMQEIRELIKEDKERIRYIVVETAGGIYKEKPEATKLLFCDYYVDHGEGFVLLSDGIVVGYILCSRDYKQYVKTFKKEYLPKVKEVDKSEYIKKNFELIMDKYLGRKYPAHLHIDILEDFCGGGNGTKLMTALLNKLKEEKVKGIWLGVDTKNTRAISFYNKMGFKTNCIKKLFGIYTLKLN